MSTRNLDLELWPAGALQASIPVNDSFQTLDGLVRPGGIVEAITATPPTTLDSDAGKTWVVDGSATGAWSGHDGDIALCTAADLWRFYVPDTGWLVHNRADSLDYIFTTTWEESSSGASSRNSVTALSISTGVVDVDCSLGDYFTLSLTANVTSITFSNLPGSGKGASLAVRIRQDGTGSRTVALPASFKPITGSDTSVQSAANAYTILTMTTFDNGTRWEYSMKPGAA